MPDTHEHVPTSPSPLGDHWIRLLTNHLLGSVHEGIIVYDRGLRYRLWNPFMERISGKSAAEVLGRLPLDVFPWLKAVGIMDRLQAALARQAPEPLEFPAEVLGRPCWMVNTTTAMHDEHGEVVGLIGIVHDVTDRKRAEIALREQERLLAETQRIAHVGSWTVALTDGRASWSDESYRIFGLPERSCDVSPELFLRMVHPDDRTAMEGWLVDCEANRHPGELEFRIVRPDGSLRTILGRGNLEVDQEGRPVRMIGSVHDITDRVRSATALRESERRLELAVRSSGAGVWDWHVRENDMVWNDRMLELYGYTRESFPGGVEAWKRGLHPADRERATAESEAALRGGGPYDTQFRVVRPDGSVIHIKADGLVVRDADGAAVRMTGLNRDITEAVRADERKQEDTRLIAECQRAARAGWYSLDIATGIWQSSPQLDEIFGIPPDFARDVAGWVNIVHPDDRETMLDHFQRHVVQERNPFDHKYRIVRFSDGAELWVHGRGALTLDASGAPLSMSGLIQDITEAKAAESERERLEEHLQHAQKMEAIGTLAGGVAHDFNNILGGILGGLSLLELELGDRAGVSADIENMKGLVQRGADLAKQLLGFARRGRYDAKPLDLERVVRDTGAMFGRTRRDVTLHYHFAPGLQAVLMDHTQLEQILLNLFLNAGQAMSSGGRILVTADNVLVADSEAAALQVETGRFVRLVVSDTGTGMDAATKARAFEPFFTTKPAGHGSGLGLASTYGIVRNHGGAITVESDLGKGATFTILVPATERRPADTRVRSAVRHEGSGTILVVDDEAPLRGVCAQLLTRMGYDVLTADGGRAALEVVDANRDRISLVILDLTMPDMSGAETFDAIRRTAPNQKVLLASGFSGEGQAQELLDRGCNGFIQKPFDMSTLSAKLRELL